MKLLSNLKISYKFSIILVIFALGFLLFAGYSFSTLNQVKVNGPIFNDIVDGNNLIADILPPPEYILESYLTLFQMKENINNPARLNELENYFEISLKQPYYDRHDFWIKNGLLISKDDSIKKAFLTDSYKSADEFYKVVENEYLPAINSKNDKLADELLNGKITDIYDSHRKSINLVVELTNKKVSEIANNANNIITSKTAQLIIIAVVSFLISVVLFVFVLVQLLSSINNTIAMLKDIAEGEGDLTKKLNVEGEDELAEMAKWFNLFTEKIRNLVKMIADNSKNAAATAEELSATSEQVNSATVQVNATVQEIAKGGQTLSQAATESKVETEKLISSIRIVANSAQNSSKGAHEVNEAARKGQEFAKLAGQKMKSISNSVGSSADAIKLLEKKSQEINKITEVITSISEQTNLLALNAAIEAARAGDAGRGFAVVADEVRKLAEESQKATEQIEGMVSEIMQSTKKVVETMQKGKSEVEEGSEVVNNALSALELISKNVSELASGIDEISAATQAQLVGSQTVQKTIQDVSAVAEESAASSEEVSASVEETTSSMNQVASAAQNLAKSADELQKIISKFKV